MDTRDALLAMYETVSKVILKHRTHEELEAAYLDSILHKAQSYTLTELWVTLSLAKKIAMSEGWMKAEDND